MNKTVKKIYWESPEDTNIRKVEISYSPTQYGNYTVATTIQAVSNGSAYAGTATWVTSYIDSTGLRTNWYKIRFKDSSENYTDYSDPVTSNEPSKLCTIDEVKSILDCVGRFTDDDIYNAIDETDSLIYMECGTPLAGIITPVGKIDNTVQELYYVGEEDIYKVDRIFYGTYTKVELFPDDQFQFNSKYGMIKLITTGTYAVALDELKELEIRYVPKIFNKLCIYRTIQLLLEKLDMTTGTKSSKELALITKKVESIESILSHKIGVQISSDLKYYNPVYGVNTKKLEQDFFRNRYIASTGLGGW